MDIVIDTVSHPAKFSSEVLLELHRQLDGFAGLILDPFAGVGGVHRLENHPTVRTLGIEIEPKWAAMHELTQVGDATNLAIPTGAVDAIVTSPCYGNRMADNDPRDTCVTYRSKLGEELQPNNAGSMQWGPEYRDLHANAWGEAWRVLRPGGIFLLNISDHVRNSRRVKVVAWHVRTLEEWGFRIMDIVPIATRRMGRGANRDARVDAELLIRLVKP